jgi:hypothetical protein
MTASGLNALGYQDVPPLPDTRPSAKRAADLLEASVTRTVNDREARELEALQGIGFALLAIVEQLSDDARPQETLAGPRWFRRHLNRR